MRFNLQGLLHRINGASEIKVTADLDVDAPIEDLETLEKELIALSKHEGSSRFTATIPVICAALLAVYIFLATLASYEVRISPASLSTWISLLRIVQSLIGISIAAYPAAQSVDQWWRYGKIESKAAEVERQFEQEIALASRVSPKLFMDEERRRRIDLQSTIIGIRAGRMPNWTTASSTLLAIPLSVLLSLWLQEPAKLEPLLDYHQPNSFVVFGIVAFLATLLLASLSRTDRLAREQERLIRVSVILKLAKDGKI